MLKQVLLATAACALLMANAYATTAVAVPLEEKEFPLTIVFALIAVLCGVGTALFAASQSKTKKED